MRKSLTILLISILFLLGCRPEQESSVIKVGLTHGKSHSFSQALEHFSTCLEEQSNGRLKVKIFHSSQIGSEKEMQEMLTIGSLDICLSGILNTYEPLFTLFELPYLYKNREHALKVNTGPIMQEVASSLEANGIVLIGFYENGFRNISTSNKAVNHPSDLEGLKIRTPENPAQIQTIRALGGIPTPLSFSELYTALIQGVADGQENPLQNIWYGRLYESQKYIAKTQHIYNSLYITASKRLWKSLDSNDQQLILDCINQSSRWQLEYMKKLDVELEDKMKSKGVSFTYPDKAEFAAATEPAYEEMYKILGENARGIVQAIRNID